MPELQQANQNLSRNINLITINNPQSVGGNQLLAADEKTMDTNNISDGGSDSEDECDDRRTLNDVSFCCCCCWF